VRVPVSAAVARLRAGFPPVSVAGRIAITGTTARLGDASGDIELAAVPAGAADGDIVAGRLVMAGDGRGVLDAAGIVARRSAPPTRTDRSLGDAVPRLVRRAAIVRGIREFFTEQAFLEVETPARVRCPGLEPHLVPVGTDGALWLVTSPELHLKRLLAAGAERLFEIARVWRGDATLDDLVPDVVGLLRRTARAAGLNPGGVRGCDLSLGPERVTVRDAFRRHAGIDLAALRERDALAGALERLGIASAPDDTWDELFFRVFVERVEPRLGQGRVTILEEYPASQAALARVRDDPGWPVALRFEVYARGIELANAFDELTDPAEQRRRHEADRAHRRAHGAAVPDLDEDFLGALAAGHPPAAGIALGVDRLVALLLGLDDVRDTVAFS
jgi:elongation factor P--(R)-beta-lysine ligase